MPNSLERPLRLTFQVTPERMAQFKEVATKKLYPVVDMLKDLFDSEPHKDFNNVKTVLEKALKTEGWKLTKNEIKLVYEGLPDLVG